MITIQPARYALVGQPIDTSPSPAMHNAAFRHLNIDATYELRPTMPVELPQVLAELEMGMWQGLNVTAPLKTLLAPSVHTDAIAQRAGAINTVWRASDDHIWHGALTDIEGIRDPIATRLFATHTDQHALILGAGGATRAAIIALEQLHVQTIHIAARRVNEARNVAQCITPTRRGQIIALDDHTALQKIFSDLHVIIQATPVGRNGDRHTLPWDRIHPRLMAFDMVYHPRTTLFLRDAKYAGAAACIEGWEMLLEQGAAAFTLWTRQPAPKAIMQQAILEHLQSLKAS